MLITDMLRIAAKITGDPSVRIEFQINGPRMSLDMSMETVRSTHPSYQYISLHQLSIARDPEDLMKHHVEVLATYVKERYGHVST